MPEEPDGAARRKRKEADLQAFIVDAYAKFFEDIQRVTEELLVDTRTGLDLAKETGAPVPDAVAVKLDTATKLHRAMSDLVTKAQRKLENGE